MHIKRIVSILLFVICIGAESNAQEMGLSFSFFFPKDGDFSVPITPFSLRGVGVDFNKYSGFETGFSLYRMSGMNINNIPFESDKSLVGPFFSIFVPLDLVLRIESKKSVFKVKGGLFGFYNFDTKLNEGNIDRELKNDLGWALLNSNFEIKNKPGWGYSFGAEYVHYFNKKFGISLEGKYLVGEAKLDLKGTYSGLENENSNAIITEEIQAPDAALDFSGIEISMGILFVP